MKQAVLQKESGRLQEAESLCRTILRQHPNHAGTLQLLGIITMQQGRHEDSIHCLQNALRLNPQAIDCYFHLGRVLAKSGNLDSAAACFEHVCAMEPGSSRSLFELGRLCKQQGRNDQAVAYFRAAIRVKPDFIAALNNLGNLLQAGGASAEAAACFHEVLRIDPTTAAAHYNLGNIHLVSGEPDRAEQCYLEAVRHKPGFADPYYQLGIIQLGKEQLPEALENLEKAVSCNPGHVEALLSLADLYRREGAMPKVIALLQRLVALRPDHAMAWNNLGAALQACGAAKKAAECYRRVIELDPDLVQVYANMGQLHQSLGRNLEAMAAYEEALKRDDPFSTQVFYADLDLRLTLCDWQDYEKRIEELTQRSQDYINDPDHAFELPVYILGYIDLTPYLYKAVAIKQAALLSRKARAFGPLQLQPPPPGSAVKKRKIRIGYISPNFRKHPAGVLVHEAFRHHDRTCFEIYAYSLVDVDDRFSRSIRQDVDVFRDVSRLSTAEAAGQIRRDSIDILVTLAGYTTHTRTDILALQPAPVQAHYLGYHQTMGADFIPYTFADPVIRTETTEEDFTEAIIELPDCVMLNSPVYPTDNQATRNDYALPLNAFVFASFNFPRKISPLSFASWMRILDRVPGSSLWLYDADLPEVRANLCDVAEQRGIDPGRLIFTGKIPIEEHWARFQLADLFLDTFTYNAHVTAIESLRTGLPVLTCRGTTHNSRLCSSILSAARLEEMICADVNGYEDRAVYLATHPERMAAVRSRLADNLGSAPLFDTAGTIRHLETGYQRMRDDHRAGRRPASFKI